VSTSAIGVCVKARAGATLEFGVIYPGGESHLLKQVSAQAQVIEFCSRMRRLHGEPIESFVEDRLGGFTGGLTTRQTLMALSAMNAVVSVALVGFGPVTHIPPISAKRIVGIQVPKGGDKKDVVVGLVRSLEPSFPYSETRAGNRARGVDDMADAWLLAEAGRRTLNGEATLGRPKKDAGRKKAARGAARGVPKEG
jgi:hypothetical protein